MWGEKRDALKCHDACGYTVNVFLRHKHRRQRQNRKKAVGSETEGLPCEMHNNLRPVVFLKNNIFVSITVFVLVQTKGGAISSTWHGGSASLPLPHQFVDTQNASPSSGVRTIWAVSRRTGVGLGQDNNAQAQQRFDSVRACCQKKRASHPRTTLSLPSSATKHKRAGPNSLSWFARFSLHAPRHESRSPRATSCRGLGSPTTAVRQQVDQHEHESSFKKTNANFAFQNTFVGLINIFPSSPSIVRSC